MQISDLGLMCSEVCAGSTVAADCTVPPSNAFCGVHNALYVQSVPTAKPPRWPFLRPADAMGSGAGLRLSPRAVFCPPNSRRSHVGTRRRTSNERPEGIAGHCSLTGRTGILDRFGFRRLSRRQPAHGPADH
ncbi:Multidrug resistance efflux pump [Pseudomonas syringae pv. actinidiae]|uniref:Multidrug resistance efflux pump n=1 Tax=Pseudomonas syringae pv. actinidiae TaxID=103796 RepID=A0A2V0QM49_PSESF|nr:Multidrug resistance efflux pump [Pseudomonas syringae pv. actinidiae]